MIKLIFDYDSSYILQNKHWFLLYCIFLFLFFYLNNYGLKIGPTHFYNPQTKVIEGGGYVGSLCLRVSVDQMVKVFCDTYFFTFLLWLKLKWNWACVIYTECSCARHTFHDPDITEVCALLLCYGDIEGISHILWQL